MSPRPLGEDEGIVNRRPPEREKGLAGKGETAKRRKSLENQILSWVLSLFAFYPFALFALLF
jgi:hypothetical protein